MRFASILFLLATFVSITIADDGKQPDKESAKLPPEKQMEKAIAEYREFMQVLKDPNLDVAKTVKGISEKKTEIIKLHRSLGLERNSEVYKKATADKARLERKILEQRRALAEPGAVSKGPEDAGTKMIIDLDVATLLQMLNAPIKNKGPNNEARSSRCLTRNLA